MTLDDLKTPFLWLMRQKASNYRFENDAEIYEILNFTYREICRYTRAVVREFSFNTVSGTNNYNLASIVTGAGIDDYGVMSPGGVVYPGERVLSELTMSQFRRLIDNNSVMWGYAVSETGVVHTSVNSKTLYIIDTPGEAATLYLNAWIVPAAMTLGANIPLLPEKDHNLIAEVAARLYLAVLQNIVYPIRSDPGVRLLESELAIERANNSPGIRDALPKAEVYERRYGND